MPAGLPPLFPEPTPDYVSWKDLLSSHQHTFPGKKPGSPPGQPSFPPGGPEFPPIKRLLPPWFRVAIIGAGVAGLRTAKLLPDMGIPYKIFEASDRPGGRIFTYKFASKPPENLEGKHDYYDVGAVRFPKNEANKKTFELFKELQLPSTEYVFSKDENIRFFNSER